MSNFISSRIYEDGYVEVETISGASKAISIADYAGVVQRILGESDSQVSRTTRILPQNLHSITEDAQEVILCIYQEETSREIHHASWGRHTIAAPNVLLRISLSKVLGTTDSYSIGDMRWYTSDLPRGSLPAVFPSYNEPRNRIWCLPLPNMFDSGNMCLGANSIPPIIYNDWSILNSLIEDTLWGSTFNNDLGIRDLKEDTSISRWLTILKNEHDEGRSFPYNLLR